MLGCQDFCGHYEWTFHYLRRRFGPIAVEEYWREAIAADSQSYYVDAAQQEGLLGLYKTWVQTGLDEQCDWYISVHEDENLLRLDMHQCPSKGFLLDNNLNSDEDYCDHCIGWIAPALAKCDMEITAHEHNHCGQCFWEIASTQKPRLTVPSEHDIRDSSQWNHGYLHRFAKGKQLPVVGNFEADSYIDLIVDHFSNAERLCVVGHGLRDDQIALVGTKSAFIVDAASYASTPLSDESIIAVMLEHDTKLVERLAERYHAASQPPLLLHPFFPKAPRLDWLALDLPRPIPVLPYLIRKGLYSHNPAELPPDSITLCLMLAAALKKPTVVFGMRTNPSDGEHRQRAIEYAEGRLSFMA